jgi:hypothetical protein
MTGSEKEDSAEVAMPNIKSWFNNMSVPMPVHKKLWLILRNFSIKIRHRQNCCGHPGEPGCCE